MYLFSVLTVSSLICARLYGVWQMTHGNNDKSNQLWCGFVLCLVKNKQTPYVTVYLVLAILGFYMPSAKQCQNNVLITAEVCTQPSCLCPCTVWVDFTGRFYVAPICLALSVQLGQRSLPTPNNTIAMLFLSVICYQLVDQGRASENERILVLILTCTAILDQE